MSGINKRQFMAGAVAAGLAAPTLLRAQTTTIRWGESLAASHPQVQMAERVAHQRHSFGYHQRPYIPGCSADKNREY